MQAAGAIPAVFLFHVSEAWRLARPMHIACINTFFLRLSASGRQRTAVGQGIRKIYQGYQIPTSDRLQAHSRHDSLQQHLSKILIEKDVRALPTNPPILQSSGSARSTKIIPNPGPSSSASRSSGHSGPPPSQLSSVV